MSCRSTKPGHHRPGGQPASRSPATTPAECSEISSAPVALSGLTIANGRGIGVDGVGFDDAGGGIDNESTLTVRNCTLAGNSAGQRLGGGIFNSGTLTVTNTTLAGNSASNGGGMGNAGTLTVTDSTLADNSAINGGDNGGAGGGIVNVFGTLDSDQQHPFSNSAFEGGGIDNIGTATVVEELHPRQHMAGDGGGGIDNIFGTPLTMGNTILAGNTASPGPDVDGALTSQGNNLIGNPSGASGFVATDLLGLDPLLGPLQDNGGPTQTMALLLGSPAIDAGSNALAVDASGSPLASDQPQLRPRRQRHRGHRARSRWLYLVYSERRQRRRLPAQRPDQRRPGRRQRHRLHSQRHDQPGQPPAGHHPAASRSSVLPAPAI